MSDQNTNPTVRLTSAEQQELNRLLEQTNRLERAAEDQSIATDWHYYSRKLIHSLDRKAAELISEGRVREAEVVERALRDARLLAYGPLHEAQRLLDAPLPVLL